MLDLIRKKQKSFLLKFVFWAIIAAFVGTIFLVWGKGGDQGGGSGDLAALVNGTKIDMETFRQVYVNLYRTYQNIYGERFTPDLEKKLQIRRQALDQLIEEALLVQEGERLGVTVSREQLVESIAALPAFQTDGAFDKEKYLRILARERMTPELFEKMQMHRLISMETRKRLVEGVRVSDADIEEAFRRRQERVNISFIRLSPDLLEKQVNVDESSLNAFFAERKENFRVPEKASLEYLLFDSTAYLPQVTVSSEDLQKFYQRHLDRFDLPERVRVAHIFFRVPQNADEKTRGETLQKARDVLEKIRRGENFASLAKKYSDDRETAASGGDLGEFARGSLAPPLERVAFGLKSGGVSDVVESPFGYHIIRVLEHTQARVRTLEEVREEVEKSAREEKAREIALDKAMDAYNIHRKSGDLQAAAKANGLKVRTTGLFSREETIPGIGRHPVLTNTAFTLDVGKLARPVSLDSKVILASVKERRPSHLPELDQVRLAVEKACRRQKAMELAEEKTRVMIRELAEGKSILDVAAKHNVKVQETGFFSRSERPIIPRLGNSEAWFDRVFELSEDAPVLKEPVRSGDNILVVSLKNVQKADMAKLDDKTRENLRKTLRIQKERETLSRKLQELKEKAEISIGSVLDDRP